MKSCSRACCDDRPDHSSEVFSRVGASHRAKTWPIAARTDRAERRGGWIARQSACRHLIISQEPAGRGTGLSGSWKSGKMSHPRPSGPTGTVNSHACRSHIKGSEVQADLLQPGGGMPRSTLVLGARSSVERVRAAAAAGPDAGQSDGRDLLELTRLGQREPVGKRLRPCERRG